MREKFPIKAGTIQNLDLKIRVILFQRRFDILGVGSAKGLVNWFDRRQISSHNIETKRPSCRKGHRKRRKKKTVENFVISAVDNCQRSVIFYHIYSLNLRQEVAKNPVIEVNLKEFESLSSHNGGIRDFFLEERHQP